VPRVFFVPKNKCRLCISLCVLCVAFFAFFAVNYNQLKKKWRVPSPECREFFSCRKNKGRVCISLCIICDLIITLSHHHINNLFAVSAASVSSACHLFTKKAKNHSKKITRLSGDHLYAYKLLFVRMQIPGEEKSIKKSLKRRNVIREKREE